MFRILGSMPRAVEYNLEQPWIRQPCDTEKRWSAFLAYRDQVPPRTIDGAREAIEAVTGHLYTARLFELYSREGGWPDRCADFDAYIDSQRVQVMQDVLAEDARAVANRHASVARDAIEVAHSVVRQWLGTIADGGRVEGWNPGHVRGMLKDMIILERLVRGEATERVEHGLVDLSLLSVSELEELRGLEAKAGVRD